MVEPAWVTAIVGAALPLIVIPYLKRGNHVDLPVERSSHVAPVPRGGGIAVIGAVLLGFAAAMVIYRGSLHSDFIDRLVPLLAIPITMGAVGLVEDLWGLGVHARLLGQAVVGILGAVWLAGANHMTLLCILPAALVIVGYVNAANFMDGVNGISGLHGAIAGIAYTFVAWRFDDSALGQSGLILVAACLAFLPWNAPHAKMFLGDSGSYLIGASVSTAALVAFFDGAPVEVAIAPTSVYLADTVWTIICRVRRGERLAEAHRSHVYQRLTDLGFSHTGSAATVSLATMAVIGLTSLRATKSLGLGLMGDAAAGLVLLGYISFPHYLRRRATLRNTPR